MAEFDGRDLLDPTTLAAVASLRIKSDTLREGLLAGLHRSANRGASVEFAEHREYAPGDDPRSVDWKVLGRTDKTYVKQYEDETNLVGTLLVDASASMAFGSPSGESKWRYAQRLAATLAWLFINRQDAVSVWTFDGAIREGLRAAGGPRQLDSSLRLLAVTSPRGSTGFATALTDLASRLHRRGVVIVLSDLFDDPDAILAGIGRLTVRGQTVHVVRIVDPQEWTFSFDRPTRFHGLEAEPDVVTDPRSLRTAYLAALADHQTRLTRGFAARSVTFHTALAGEPLVPLVRRIIASRPDRMRQPGDSSGRAVTSAQRATSVLASPNSPSAGGRGGRWSVRQTREDVVIEPGPGRRIWRWLVGT